MRNEYGEEATTFFRCTTDKQKRNVLLRDSFAGPGGSSCWLIGGGPSLKRVDIELLKQSPAPKMCINLAGTGLIRPTFWTSYDPTQRFMRSVYLDAGVMKFVNRRRATDIVPETTYKVSDCPNLYFFDGDSQRGFDDFLSRSHQAIVDWNDSMVQAIDILYQLGFRTIYLLGCEMQISPSEEMIDFARKRNVEYQPEKLLGDFLRECEAKGISQSELCKLQWPQQYHFEQKKPLEAAAATDFHYFRVAQFLRLSRRAISQAGMKLISVTAQSRLNDYFDVQSQEEASQQILAQVGDPRMEQTVGLYNDKNNRLPMLCGTMRDFQPLHWSQKPSVEKHHERNVDKPCVAQKANPSQPCVNKPYVDDADLPLHPVAVKENLHQDLERMKKHPVPIEELG